MESKHSYSDPEIDIFIDEEEEETSEHLQRLKDSATNLEHRGPLKRELSAEPTNQDINSSENIQLQESNSSIPSNNKSAPGTKRRGRPSKNCESSREWSDEETYILIDLFRKNENLYNTKHSHYYNREVRNNSLKSMKKVLEGLNITASILQIGDKLANLKCYYGNQKRMAETQASNGYGLGNFVSSWRFYDGLDFLCGSIERRKLQQRVMDDSINTPPAAKVPKKPKESQPIKAHYVPPAPIPTFMRMTSPCLEMSKENNRESESIKSEDELFTDLICKMLIQIPESEEKAMVKLNMQQMVVKLKYRSRASRQASFAPDHCSYPTYVSSVSSISPSWEQRSPTGSPSCR